MSTTFRNRILIVAICSAVLALFFLVTSPTSAASAGNTNTTTTDRNCVETAGTQLLWESLSHQFASSVEY
jgi:hypothetical protein